MSDPSDMVISWQVGEAEHSGQSLQWEDGQSLGRYGTSSVATTPYSEVVPTKKRRLQEDEDLPNERSVYHRLLQEELAKLNCSQNSSNHASVALLQHPLVDAWSKDLTLANQPLANRMQWLYLVMGTCHSLIDFKAHLRAARDRAESLNFINSTLSPEEKFMEICKLDDKEAFCVLARRYHAVKLFEMEHALLQQGHHNIIVETQDTLARGQRASRGNPNMRHEAALTDRMLNLVKPGLKEGTPEHKRVRAKLSRLRQLAKRLRVWTEHYGYGILALLPCGPSYSELTLTDNMLVLYFFENVIL